MRATTKRKPNTNKKMMMKSSLNDEVDKELTEDVSNGVDSMTEASRIRIMAGSSPPWVESELVAHALKYIDFMLRLHATGVTVKDPSNHALDRYLLFWLPLVNKYPSETVLIPPADIAWLWHCHRLSTGRYEAYCHRRFGHILECQAPFDFVEERTVHNSLARYHWWNTYPYEHFLLLNKHNTKKDYIKSGSSATRDYLIACTRLHGEFLWHVTRQMLSRDQTSFLREGVSQYMKFVALNISPTAKPSSLRDLVPTYQIALIWQTHILMGIERYNHDCRILRQGSTLVHDFLVDDRSVSNVSNWLGAVHETRRRWKAVYGEDYLIDRDMYRSSSPPPEYYRTSWTPQTGCRSKFKESTLDNKKPKKRYQVLAKALVGNKPQQQLQSEQNPTTNHPAHEGPMKRPPKKRYQVFLGHRRRKEGTPIGT